MALVGPRVGRKKAGRCTIFAQAWRQDCPVLVRDMAPGHRPARGVFR